MSRAGLHGSPILRHYSVVRRGIDPQDSQLLRALLTPPTRLSARTSGKKSAVEAGTAGVSNRSMTNNGVIGDAR